MSGWWHHLLSTPMRELEWYNLAFAIFMILALLGLTVAVFSYIDGWTWRRDRRRRRRDGGV